MPRPKGSTNKKTKEVKDTFKVSLTEGIELKAKLTIEPLGLRFGQEDMNQVVDKLNEVIAFMNK